MFHLTANHLDDSLSMVIAELRDLAEVLGSGYDLPSEVLGTASVANGYRTLATSLVAALTELSEQMMKQERHHPKGSRLSQPFFDLSTPAVPDIDLPEAAPAEGFVPGSVKSDALDIAMHGYFVGRLAAELDAAPSASAVKSASAKARELTAALRKRDGIDADGAPILTVDETDAAWAEHVREFVAKAGPKRSRGRNAA